MQETASRVVRVVVAGGLLGGEEPNVGARAAASAKAIAVETVREADLALTQLASGVPGCLTAPR